MDFTVKEISLDFSKMKSAAYGLWSKSGKMFSLSSNNAVLEFLLEVSCHEKIHCMFPVFLELFCSSVLNKAFSMEKI